MKKCTHLAHDRGSAAVWLVSMAGAISIILGIGVDLSGMVHAYAHAQDAAAHAARAAGEEIDASAMRGTAARANVTAAISAAHTTLRGLGVSGDVAIRDGSTIAVDIQDAYPTKFLTLIGLDTLPVTGHAEARITRAVQGVPR